MKAAPFFTVIYDDAHIIAVNKAAGISVGGDRWDESKERLDRLVEASASPPLRLFRVHRIDRDTSGLVVFAKTPDMQSALSGIFENRQVHKRYIAIVNGRPLWNEEICELPLIPDGNKKHMTIVDKFRGKKSVTRFRLLGSAGMLSVLEALPETGRTHQIRVHAAALGFPVVCDPLYGKDRPIKLSSFKRGWRGDPEKETPLLSRLGLHAAELRIPAGVCTESELCLSAPLARDMDALITQMGKMSGQALLP